MLAADLMNKASRYWPKTCVPPVPKCLSPLSISDPLLQERQKHEQPYIREVVEKQSHRTVIIPWQIDPPVGKIGLEHLLKNTDLSIAKA